MLRRFWDWITGRTATRRMLDDFVRRYPGRCPICSYHRYGPTHGHTSKAEPEPHDCIERG
jgi:hypothetical protein